MDKDNFIFYLKMLNEFQAKQAKNEGFNFTDEQLKLIATVNEMVKNDAELKKIVDMPLEKRIKYVEDYQKQQEKSLGVDEDTKAIQEAYGFDISKIENKKLDSGIEIFKFYSPKLERIVILENRKDMSLTEQLKEKQAFNEEFQTSDDKSNTNEMLEQERLNNDIELKMIYVDDIDKYSHLISSMSDEKKKKLDYLVNHANELGVQKINIENLFYLDQDDNIREIVYDKEKDVFIDQEPNSLEANINDINTSERINPSYNEIDQKDALANDFEDNSLEKESVDFNELDEDTISKIETFIEYPELLENLDEVDREKWNNYIDIYNKNNIMSKENEKAKQYVKTLDDNRYSGAVEGMFLGIISLFIAGALLAIISLLK